MLGNIKNQTTVIQNLPLEDELESAYATYSGDKLTRIAVINLHEYNYTATANASSGERPEVEYTFQIPGLDSGKIGVRRLMANGSDALSGITFDGYSYNYELDEGKPVRLNNVTVGEKAEVSSDGKVTVKVHYSSVAVLDL